MKVGFFRPLYSHLGDYVSVYLDTLRVHEGTHDEVRQRWRAARRRLTEAGAPAGTLDAIEAVVADPARAAPGRALFARDGRITFTAPLGAAPRREIARVGQLPHLMPLLAQRPPSAPHPRVATASRNELAALRAASQNAGSPHSLPVQKAARAGFVLLDHLPKPLKPRAHAGDRKAGTDGPPIASRPQRSDTARADRESRARFGEWQARRAHSGTVEGLRDTLAALREGQVADLFIADRPASTATVWIGPDGADVATTLPELHARGVPDPVPERADAAIVRALAATDAELHFLPEDLVTTEPTAGGHVITFPRDGICATLRWGEAR
jgi:hypothetical protein